MKLCSKCKIEFTEYKSGICKLCARKIFLDQLIRNPLCCRCKKQPHGKNVLLCYECRKEYQKQRRLKDAGGWYKRLTPEQKQKRRSRGVIYISVKRGKIQRGTCEICGSKNAEAHHHNGYDKEHSKDVRWFCKTHHVEVERKKIPIDIISTTT